MKAVKRVTLLKYFLLPLLSFAIITGCGEDNPTQPSPPVTDDSDLLVDVLSVALVKGGTQTVRVSAYDKNANPEKFEVTSGNTDIATATKLDTTSFAVGGVNYGSTNIVVTTNSGKTKEIPTTIYNPKILETDELLITYAQTFHAPWYCLSDQPPVAFAYPVVTDGFRSLGSLCYEGSYNPDGVHGVMVVKAKPGSDALAAPVDYTYLWGADPNWDNCSFWRPIPPTGYRAMGVVQWAGYNKPLLDAVTCVREDLTIMGEAGDFIAELINGLYYHYFWKIEPPVSGPHENAYFSTGTFVSANAYSAPSIDPVMNVLNVQLPMLTEAPYQQYVPKLTGYDPPPGETVPVLARKCSCHALCLTILNIVATRCGESRTPRFIVSNDKYFINVCITTTTRLPFYSTTVIPEDPALPRKRAMNSGRKQEFQFLPKPASTYQYFQQEYPPMLASLWDTQG